MTRRTVFVLLVASLPALAMAGTKFTSTWKPPDAKPVNFRGQKVVALVMMKDVKTRNGVEDELAYVLRQRGLVGVSAHTLLPPEQTMDKEQVRAHFEQAGVVGAVVLRSVDKQTQLTEGASYFVVTNYSSFYGYYGWGWSGIYDPGYVTMDNFFTVETLIYDVKNDKLLWAAVTQTKNPKRVDNFLKDLGSAVGDQLRKEGLVQK
jgi:hypothetical protein